MINDPPMAREMAAKVERLLDETGIGGFAKRVGRAPVRHRDHAPILA